MGSSWSLPFRRISAVISAIAVLMILCGGIAMIAGLPQSGGWQRSRPVGFILLGAAVVILVFTVRRWVKWLVGFLLFTSLKLVLILVFGYYWTGPVSRLLALEGLILFILIAALTYKFVSHGPQTKLDVAALVGAVVGLASMIVSNSIWPLLIVVVLLAAARLLGKPVTQDSHTV